MINTHSEENGSNTPDYILAKYLDDCLEAFNGAMQSREKRVAPPHEDNGAEEKSTKNCKGKKYCDCAKEAMVSGANRDVVDGLNDGCKFNEAEVMLHNSLDNVGFDDLPIDEFQAIVQAMKVYASNERNRAIQECIEKIDIDDREIQDISIKKQLYDRRGITDIEQYKRGMREMRAISVSELSKLKT